MNNKPIIRVKNVMKSDFDLIDGLATVAEALTSAKYLETKCLIVNKRHANDEYGIVLLSDIAKNVIARDKSPHRINIYEIMSKPVVSVDPEMDVRYCARLFENLGLNRAPVLDSERNIIGVIGYTDLVLRGLRDRL